MKKAPRFPKAGAAIARRMADTNTSAASVAKALGVTTQAVNKYTLGVNLPNAERLLKLSRLLSIPWGDLLADPPPDGAPGTRRARTPPAYALLHGDYVEPSPEAVAKAPSAQASELAGLFDMLPDDVMVRMRVFNAVSTLILDAIEGRQPARPTPAPASD